MPFPLGRPFGAPNEPAFQVRVLRATLDLLNRESGPVLEDFPDDAPGMSAADEAPWACPLPLASPETPADEQAAFEQQLLAEIGQLKTWHEQAVRKHGRTGMGATSLGPDRVEELARLVAAAAFGEIAEAPAGAAVEMPLLLRFAADDLRAFYMESASAQPAARPPTPDELARWLYGSTTLGEAFYMARDALGAKEDDRVLQTMGRLMVPGAYNQRPPRN